MSAILGLTAFYILQEQGRKGREISCTILNNVTKEMKCLALCKSISGISGWQFEYWGLQLQRPFLKTWCWTTLHFFSLLSITCPNACRLYCAIVSLYSRINASKVLLYPRMKNARQVQSITIALQNAILWALTFVGFSFRCWVLGTAAPRSRDTLHRSWRMQCLSL